MVTEGFTNSQTGFAKGRDPLLVGLFTSVSSYTLLKDRRKSDTPRKVWKK